MSQLQAKFWRLPVWVRLGLLKYETFYTHLLLTHEPAGIVAVKVHSQSIEELLHRLYLLFLVYVRLPCSKPVSHWLMTELKAVNATEMFLFVSASTGSAWVKIKGLPQPLCFPRAFQVSAILNLMHFYLTIGVKNLVDQSFYIYHLWLPCCREFPVCYP